MSYRVFLAAVMTAALAGCNTIDTKTAFDGRAGGAFLVVAADGLSSKWTDNHIYSFRGVDLATSTFKDEWVMVRYYGSPTTGNNEFVKPATMATTMRFAGQLMPAGDYALVAKNNETNTGASLSVFETYFSEGAQVVRVADGKTNVIVMGGREGLMGGDESTAMAQTAELMKAYPNFTAPQAIVQPLGTITFESKKTWGAETCNNRKIKSFTFTPKHD